MFIEERIVILILAAGTLGVFIASAILISTSSNYAAFLGTKDLALEKCRKTNATKCPSKDDLKDKLKKIDQLHNQVEQVLAGSGIVLIGSLVEISACAYFFFVADVEMYFYAIFAAIVFILLLIGFSLVASAGLMGKNEPKIQREAPIGNKKEAEHSDSFDMDWNLKMYLFLSFVGINMGMYFLLGIGVLVLCIWLGKSDPNSEDDVGKRPTERGKKRPEDRMTLGKALAKIMTKDNIKEKTKSSVRGKKKSSKHSTKRQKSKSRQSSRSRRGRVNPGRSRTRKITGKDGHKPGHRHHHHHHKGKRPPQPGSRSPPPQSGGVNRVTTNRPNSKVPDKPGQVNRAPAERPNQLKPSQVGKNQLRPSQVGKSPGQKYAGPGTGSRVGSKKAASQVPRGSSPVSSAVASPPPPSGAQQRPRSAPPPRSDVVPKRK